MAPTHELVITNKCIHRSFHFLAKFVFLIFPPAAESRRKRVPTQVCE